MEVLSPSHPTGKTEVPLSGVFPPVTFRGGFGRRSRKAPYNPPEIMEEDGGKVFVAVGKSVDKAFSLLQWTLRTFVNSEVCILHVHQPSPLIPTLLGRLPASRANDEVVSAFRNEELEMKRKLLNNYLSMCSRAKVKASIVSTEADQVHKEIVNLVRTQDIRKLVIGALPDCMKLKKGSTKASYAAKMAPSSCEIWFVSKGKLVWKRQNFEGSSSTKQICQDKPTLASNLRSQSLLACKNDITVLPGGPRSNSARYLSCCEPSNHFQREGLSAEFASSSILHYRYNPTSTCLSSPASFSSISSSSLSDPRLSSDSGNKNEDEDLYEQLAEVKRETEQSRDEALTEVLRCRKLEVEAVKTISQVRAFESAHAREVELRKEVEDAFRHTIQEQEELLEERRVITHELHQAMRNIAVLDSRAQEANRRCNEVSGELKFIQASIATLQQEKQKIQRQKKEALLWLDHWKNCARPIVSKANGFMQVTGDSVEDSLELTEFTLSDLQSATCDFSESFKIGQGGSAEVYKGEMLGRTVAIKKLHPHNIQKQPEFLHEAQILARLHHPHLVSLVGICPEAWSLVYDYLPGGNLQDRLLCKSNNVCPLDWKIRTQIIAEIASCLLFLHSLNPETIVHGDLKPKNILLDSNNSCKICDAGTCRLLPEKTLRCPSFRRCTETNDIFPYTDPEYHRTGILTTKSDIFSFGLIILQLLTGRSPVGLVSEVRRAISFGKITSIMDSSGGEWSMFVARRLADLGLQCCELYGRDRPELTPNLVRELEQLHTLEDRPVPSFFLCPILQDIMHDPQVSADGFTYEGEAIRGWLENGRETSPMTNLTLTHLTLTPNHTLQLAIREWLCKS